MNQPKVSIIVPVYNVEKYIPRCMESLLNQTLTDIEIILVDDESPDHCPALCDEYAKQDSRVKVIHKTNGGLGFARNSGLEAAAGEYVAFVDSDDFVETGTYQKLYSLAADTGADIVYFTYQRFNDRGDVWGKTAGSKEKRYSTAAEIQGFMLDMIANPPKAKSDRDIQVSSCCALYRHEVIRQHELRFKSERELISEDLLFNLDCLLHASSVIAIPDALYSYRVNTSSLSRTVRPDRIVKNIFFYRHLQDMLDTNGFGYEGYLRATRFFIGYSRCDIRQYVQSPHTKTEKMQWLKETVKNDIWTKTALYYPYRQLPLKYALHFYLLLKRHVKLLYCLSR